MKRFVLNKIKVAKLVTLKGKGPTPNGGSVDLQQCVTDDCPTANLISCGGEMECTNTSIDTCDATNPAGTDTLPS